MPIKYPPKTKRQRLISFICDADTRIIDDHGFNLRQFHFQEDEGNVTIEECMLMPVR